MKTNSTFFKYAVLLIVIQVFAIQLKATPPLYNLSFNSTPSAMQASTAFIVGNKFKFGSVASGTDAIVTIVSATGGATVALLDDNTTTMPEAFSRGRPHRGAARADREDAAHAHRLDHHVAQPECQQQRIVNAPAVKRPHQKPLAQQPNRAHSQGGEHEAEPEAAGESEEVNTQESADHEKRAMREIHDREHAKNQRQANRQQRIDGAERKPRHQLQQQKLKRNI